MNPVTFSTSCRHPLEGSPFHANPLVDNVMRRRGVFSHDRICPGLNTLLHPSGLKDIDRASALIEEAIVGEKQILVIADYDCDGACSCAVMVRALRMLGARHVEYAVPDRFVHGYGTTPSLVDSIAHLSPGLIITVDNGISSFDGVERIRQLMPDTRILVTDHHTASPDGRLPDADAVVNPNRLDCNFGSGALCGCGVAWYVGVAALAHMRANGTLKAEEAPDFAMLLDLVALATVADIVSLDDNNRALVDAGLRLTRHGGGNIGMLAIFDAAGKDSAEAVSSDFGFAIGPRLNSAGRLTTMEAGIECLLADDRSIANFHARGLCGLNDQRKGIQQSMIDFAHKMVSGISSECRSLVVASEMFHEGVSGLVASRMKEDYGLPCFAFAVKDGETLKGSGRSVPGVHLYDTLSAIQRRHAERHNGETLMPGFGGHAMAAGLSLRSDGLSSFAALLDEVVKERLSSPVNTIATDGEVSIHDLTFEKVRELRDISPYGRDFPEPLFELKGDVIETRSMGRQGQHRAYRIRSEGRCVEMVAFNVTGREHLFDVSGSTENSCGVRVVFQPGLRSTPGGEVSLQMIVELIGPA